MPIIDWPMVMLPIPPALVMRPVLTAVPPSKEPPIFRVPMSPAETMLPPKSEPPK